MTVDRLSDWTIYVVNDCCPDYTWGFTEEQTRQAMADLVAAHLDEMTRTDGEAPEHRDHYTMAVTQEALCFLERYPERKDELIRRVREGRITVTPILCNTLWGLQSMEGAIRACYPARRLEREWGVRFDVADHIELPSLPWGMATLLAGCGIRWVSIPFLDYDSTFSGLENPPLFRLEGPDGSQINVILDKWASLKGNYTQAAHLLRDPKQLAEEWVHHYRDLGGQYPWRLLLASGTHGDLSPESGAQVQGFSDAIHAYNAQLGEHPKLVNATLAQFCDAVETAGHELPVVRGDFGHSWELWPVSLASLAAAWRRLERGYLAAEALIAAAGRGEVVYDASRLEWSWLMLSDHAWNGTDDENRRHNAGLRRGWSDGEGFDVPDLTYSGWHDSGLGLVDSGPSVTVFNSQSGPRRDLVGDDESGRGAKRVYDVTVLGEDFVTPSQVVREAGGFTRYFVSPEVPGFGFRTLTWAAKTEEAGEPRARVSRDQLESPFYHLHVDRQTGGLRSLVYKPADRELVVPGTGRSLLQTVYVRGEERPVTRVRTHAVTEGPVLARLEITAELGEAVARTQVTVYAELDRVDFAQWLEKPATAEEERLTHVFPVAPVGATLRVETPGAVLRPYPQPRGDFLPGADLRRLAVQGFVDVERPDGVGVTIAPLDTFALRLDLDPITFEALGNDQNPREVTRDQGGETSFPFRYSLRGYVGAYSQPEAVAWSRSVGAPLLHWPGKLSLPTEPPVTIDPSRAIATCLKPVDDLDEPGLLLRLWETAGQRGPLAIPVQGFTRAVLTDLLERELEGLPIRNGAVAAELPPHGMVGIRLIP